MSNTMWVSYSDMKKLDNLSVASLINEGHKLLVLENQNYIKMIGRTYKRFNIFLCYILGIQLLFVKNRFFPAVT